jgi:hypothetical protein
MVRELYYPVLDCFVRGLPHNYRNITAPEGTSVLLEISGNCGGIWVVCKVSDGWRFRSSFPETIACKVVVPQEIAWRIFTKGIAQNSARAQVDIEGDQDLADGILGLIAIIG